MSLVRDAHERNTPKYLSPQCMSVCRGFVQVQHAKPLKAETSWQQCYSSTGVVTTPASLRGNRCRLTVLILAVPRVKHALTSQGAAKPLAGPSRKHETNSLHLCMLL